MIRVECGISKGTDDMKILIPSSMAAATPVTHKSRNQPRHRGIQTVLMLLALLLPHARAISADMPFCRSVDGSSNHWVVFPLPENTGEEINSINRLVEVFRRRYKIPLSFIEGTGAGGWGQEPLELPVNARTVDAALRKVAESYPLYTCEIRGDRLIFRTKESIFDSTVAGVDIVNQGRSTAVLAYLKHLRTFDKKFANWSDGIRATVGEEPWPPENEEKINLAPRATLMDHLVQLLGHNQNECFSVPYLHAGAPRTIYTENVDPWAVQE